MMKSTSKVKLKNRRVLVSRRFGPYMVPNFVQFKRLLPEAPKGSRVKITQFTLTDEALIALVNCIETMRNNGAYDSFLD